MKNLKLRLIMLCHPNYKLVADTFCDCSCLAGCNIVMTGLNPCSEQIFCCSDNGVGVYRVPMYALLYSGKKKKYVRYKTECYNQANDIYQLILAKKRIPIGKGIN